MRRCDVKHHPINTTPNPTSGSIVQCLMTVQPGGRVNPTGTITFNLYGVNDQTAVRSDLHEHRTGQWQRTYNTLPGSPRWRQHLSLDRLLQRDANNNPVSVSVPMRRW